MLYFQPRNNRRIIVLSTTKLSSLYFFLALSFRGTIDFIAAFWQTVASNVSMYCSESSEQFYDRVH